MNELSASQLSLNRAALYRWFSCALMAPPSAAEVVDMNRGPARRLLDSMAMAPAASVGIRALQQVLADGSAEQVADRIGAAHARLFYGAGGQDSALPYRSVQTSEGGLMCQQAADEMQTLLRQHRLRLDEQVHEPADHLCVQLEVMAQLACRAAEAAQADAWTPEAAAALQAEQAGFLASQLLSWLPGFVQCVADADPLGYHLGLSRALLALVEQDHELLSDTCTA